MGKTRIGIIGINFIANASHIPEYQQIEDCEITALCDINTEALKQAAEQLHIPAARCFADYRDLVACPEVDAVDISTPNFLHCRIAEEAIRARKPFALEKPMGINYAETLRVMKQAGQASVPGFICYSWRYRPNIRYIRELLAAGAIGTVHQMFFTAWKDSGMVPDRRLEWRFDKEKSGAGVLFDFNSHMVDITRFFGIEFDSVAADGGVVVKQRKLIGSEEYGEVTADDYCNIIARMTNGASGCYRISRATTGLNNLILLELFGSDGMIRFRSHGWKPEEQTLEISTIKPGITGEGTRVVSAPDRLYRPLQMETFIDLIHHRQTGVPALLSDGVINQRVLGAELRAMDEKRWVSVDEITE